MAAMPIVALMVVLAILAGLGWWVHTMYRNGQVWGVAGMAGLFVGSLARTLWD